MKTCSSKMQKNYSPPPTICPTPFPAPLIIVLPPEPTKRKNVSQVLIMTAHLDIIENLPPSTVLPTPSPNPLTT